MQKQWKLSKHKDDYHMKTTKIFNVSFWKFVLRLSGKVKMVVKISRGNEGYWFHVGGHNYRAFILYMKHLEEQISTGRHTYCTSFKFHRPKKNLRGCEFT